MFEVFPFVPQGGPRLGWAREDPVMRSSNLAPAQSGESGVPGAGHWALTPW